MSTYYYFRGLISNINKIYFINNINYEENEVILIKKIYTNQINKIIYGIYQKIKLFFDTFYINNKLTISILEFDFFNRWCINDIISSKKKDIIIYNIPDNTTNYKCMISLFNDNYNIYKNIYNLDLTLITDNYGSAIGNNISCIIKNNMKGDDIVKIIELYTKSIVEIINSDENVILNILSYEKLIDDYIIPLYYDIIKISPNELIKVSPQLISVSYDDDNIKINTVGRYSSLYYKFVKKTKEILIIDNIIKNNNKYKTIIVYMRNSVNKILDKKIFDININYISLINNNQIDLDINDINSYKEENVYTYNNMIPYIIINKISSEDIITINIDKNYKTIYDIKRYINNIGIYEIEYSIYADKKKYSVNKIINVIEYIKLLGDVYINIDISEIDTFRKSIDLGIQTYKETEYYQDIYYQDIPNKIGIYIIKYYYYYNKIEYSVYRYIKILKYISLIGGDIDIDISNINDKNWFDDPGIILYNNSIEYMQNIYTIPKIIGTNKIEYYVIINNIKYSVYREVRVINFISLIGDKIVNIDIFNKYVEKEVNTFNNMIPIIEGDIITTKVGVYNRKYTVIDNKNKKYSVTRTINVNKIIPSIYQLWDSLSNPSYLYLEKDITLSKNWTIEVWTTITKYNGNSTMWEFRDKNISSDILQLKGNINSNGKLNLLSKDNKFTNESINNISLNKWSHIVWQRKDNIIEYYINGYYEGESIIDENIYDNLTINNIYIGVSVEDLVQLSNIEQNKLKGNVSQLHISNKNIYTREEPYILNTNIYNNFSPTDTILLLGNNFKEYKSNNTFSKGSSIVGPIEIIYYTII